jgi:hypothetical protein
MRKLATAVLLVTLLSSAAISRQRPQPLKIEEPVLDFYVGEFQRVVNTNQDLFVKVRPFLREFVENRFEISARRQDTMQQLQMLVQDRKSSDDDIRRVTRDVDKADSDIQANQERFLSNVGPLLSIRQQARVRVFLQMADQRMRALLNSIRNNANPQPPTPDNKK